jgi:histidine ammonia-lyase
MLAVRANQLLAGGAGLRPTVVTALCEALENGVYPVVNEFGSVGTGDIAALAQVGLALVGEHPWRVEGGGRGGFGGRAGPKSRRAPCLNGVPGAGVPEPYPLRGTAPSPASPSPNPSTTTTRWP